MAAAGGMRLEKRLGVTGAVEASSRSPLVPRGAVNVPSSSLPLALTPTHTNVYRGISLWEGRPPPVSLSRHLAGVFFVYAPAMPPLPSVPKVIKITFKHSYGGDTDVLSTIHEEYTGTPPTTAEIATFATACGAAWDSNMAAYASSAQVSLEEVYATDLSSDTAAQAQVAAVFPGTGGGAALPADTCFVIGYEIARRYRGGHSRGYWPLGTETEVLSPQLWTTAAVTAMTATFVGMQAAIAAAGWSGAGTISQVNVSYFSGFTVVTSPTTGRARNVPTVRATPLIDPIVDVVGRQPFGSQRRRVRRLR